MSDYKFSRVEKTNHLLTVHLNRPERMNAIHPPTSLSCPPCLTISSTTTTCGSPSSPAAESAPSALAMILKYQAEGGDMSMPDTGFAGLTSRYDMKKPIIAAVNGVAMGGGFEIALACDIILASDNAVFALPEPRVGLAALAGGLHRLPRQIPSNRQWA